MRIVICSDTQLSMISGVNTALNATVPILKSKGHNIKHICSETFWSFSCPRIPEMQIAFPSFSSISKNLKDPFDAIHITGEGPLGFQMSRFCISEKIPFTTSYHTNLQNYADKYIPFGKKIFQPYLSWFHRRSHRILISTDRLKRKLASWGLVHTAICSLGVDKKIFYPRERHSITDRLLLYVGRVVKEKNIEAFLQSKIPGKKVVVGEGVHKNKLMRLYPDVAFLGYQHEEMLAEIYSNADVLVFPSKTDTFGLVQLESLACGTPVAAFPVEGPIDIVTDPRLGCLSENLDEAIEIALQRGDRNYCANYAHSFSWETSANQFLSHLVLIDTGKFEKDILQDRG